MITHGTAPFLECSSKGDKRFSAFHARPASLKGRSIEDAYQSMKSFSDGSTGLHWRDAKGRLAANQEACTDAYFHWWVEYILEHESTLLPVLKAATGLSDVFGQPGRVCQASVLWEIRSLL